MNSKTRSGGLFTRGVSVSMHVPRDFAWEDKVIPITLHLSRHPRQPDTTASVRFSFYDENKGSRSNTGSENGVNHRWELSEPVSLASGVSQTLDVQMPLPFNTDAIAEVADLSAGDRSLVERVAQSLALGALRPPTHIPWFRLRVSVKPEGAWLSAGTSAKMRCRNAKGQFSIGPFTS